MRKRHTEGDRLYWTITSLDHTTLCLSSSLTWHFCFSARGYSTEGRREPPAHRALLVAASWSDSGPHWLQLTPLSHRHLHILFHIAHIFRYTTWLTTADYQGVFCSETSLIDSSVKGQYATIRIKKEAVFTRTGMKNEENVNFLQNSIQVASNTFIRVSILSRPM